MMSLVALSACVPSVESYPKGEGKQVLIVPGEVHVSIGAQRIFSAVVAGDPAAEINWAVGAGGGEILPNGLYTAPQNAGDFIVTARSRRDPNSRAEATVHVVATPATPIIATTASTVTVGSLGLAANVVSPVPGLRYEWSVQNGTLSSAPTGTDILFSADRLGFVALVCNVFNQAGDSAPPATLFINVVAPLPSDSLPRVTLPRSVRAHRPHLVATVDNADPRLSYEWSTQNAEMTEGQGTARLVFTAGEVGAAVVSVRAVTEAGLRSDVASSNVEVVAGGDAVVLAGTASGAGLASGTANVGPQAGTARLSFPSAVSVDSGGNLYVFSQRSSYPIGDFRSDLSGLSRVSPAGDVQLLSVNPFDGDGDYRAITAVPSGDVFLVRSRVNEQGDERVVLMRLGAGAWELAADLGDRYSDFDDLAAMTSDSQGMLYAATDRAIYRLPAPSFVPELVVGDEDDGDCVEGNAATARFYSNVALAFHPGDDNQLYVVDDSYDRVRSVVLNGAAVSVSTAAGPDCGSNDNPLLDGPKAVAVDSAGNLYVAQSNSDYENIVAVPASDRNVLRLVAGPNAYLASQPAHRDGAGVDARFSSPSALVVLANGDLVVADSDNHVLRQISNIDLASPNPALGAQVRTTVGSVGYFTDGALSNAQCADAAETHLRVIGPVAVARDGRVVFADNGNCRLRQVATTGELLPFTGSGLDGYYGIDNGLPYYASFSNGVSDLLALPDGHFIATENVYSSSSQAQTFYRHLRHISSEGVVSSYAGSYTANQDCSYPEEYVDSQGTDARFCWVRGVDLDPKTGTLFVIDSDANRAVRGVLPDRTVLTVGFFPADAGLFYNRATSLIYDREQRIVLANQKQVPDVGWVPLLQYTTYSPNQQPVLATLAGGTVRGSDDGPCAQASFLGINGMAYDPVDDALYLADGNLVRRVSPLTNAEQCRVDTIAGQRGEYGFLPGPLPARFNRVRDVALTPSRDLVVTDDSDDVVVLIRL